MGNNIISTFVVNVLYLTIWFSINRLRKSKCKIIIDLDNGNEFYESLTDLDKQTYWEEDTKILNIFFFILLFFIEFTMFLLLKENNLWFLPLILGILIAFITVIVLSIKLRKKYKKH